VIFMLNRNDFCQMIDIDNVRLNLWPFLSMNLLLCLSKLCKKCYHVVWKSWIKFSMPVNCNLDRIQFLFWKLSNTSSLKSLDLSYIKIINRELLVALEKNNSSLLRLDLSGCSIDNNSIVPLSKLTHLHALKLKNCKIGDFSPLSNLLNLTEIDISLTNLIATRSNLLIYNSLDGYGLNFIYNLTNLTYLNIGFNKVHSDGLLYIKGLRNLTSLDMSWTNLNDSGIGHLAPLINLTFLDISNTNITDFGLNILSNSLTRLRKIILCSCRAITEKGIMSLCERLKNLTYINISCCNIRNFNILSPNIKVKYVKNIIPR